ncbi:DUF3272 family protein [Streptococcus sp. DD13]|uniref:DUF3272 family protein n=1 Tax=Streptococcus sp. DD13 TaxID=1777881 RepID=UPI0018D29252|nr:DUF3272 family protein [Streptococcus sp. DD13]
MRLSQFLILMFFTLGMTFLMNDFFLSGDFLFGLLAALFVYQQLRFALRVTRFIASVEKSTKN